MCGWALRRNHRLLQRPRNTSSLQEGGYSLCPCQVQHTLAHDLFLLVPLFSQNPLTLIFSALDEWLVEGFLTGRGDLNRTNSERIIWVSHKNTVKGFLCFTRLAFPCFFFFYSYIFIILIIFSSRSSNSSNSGSICICISLQLFWRWGNRTEANLCLLQRLEYFSLSESLNIRWVMIWMNEVSTVLKFETVAIKLGFDLKLLVIEEFLFMYMLKIIYLNRFKCSD